MHAYHTTMHRAHAHALYMCSPVCDFNVHRNHCVSEALDSCPGRRKRKLSIQMQRKPSCKYGSESAGNTWIRILGLHTLGYHDLSLLPPSVTIAVPEEPDTGMYVVKVTHIFQLSHDDLIAMLWYMCNSMDDVVMVSQ